MYASRLTLDTKIKSALSPHSAQLRSNKENMLLDSGVSTTGRQRSRSVSNTSASASSVSVSAVAPISSLAPTKPHGMAAHPQSRPSSPSVEVAVGVGTEYVLAMYDYDAPQSSTTYLSFRAGQVIHVINRDSSGWWDGELEGRRGWFPSNYVNVNFGKSKTPSTQPPSVRTEHHRVQSRASTTSWVSASSSSYHRRQSSEGFSTDPIHYSAPIMIPMVHGLSLLQNAVRSNRVTHFQPSAACIIACVRRILTSTGTINRDAPVLRKFSALAQERSKLLTTLAKLVSQARRASEESLSQNELADEITEMLKTGGLVFTQVRRFLAIAVQCGIELPQEPDDLDESSPTEGPEEADELCPNGRTPTQQRQYEKSDGSAPSPTFVRARSMVNLRNGPSTPAAFPLSKFADAQTKHIRERMPARHRAGLSISSTSSSSSFSSQGSCGPPASPQFPRGPTKSFRVLEALRYTHDQYLSIIAAFIGHAHSYSRSSHASNTGHLYELTREIVSMVEKILTIVVAVTSHPDIPTHRANNLRALNEALYTMTSTLTESIRRLTVTTPLAPLMSEEEEKAALIRSATGALKAGADCVAAVKVCLNRAGGERPFIIDLPYAEGEGVQPQPPRDKSTRGVLNKSPSMNAIHGYRSNAALEDDEDATIHPGPSNVISRSRELSSGSDNSSKTSWASSVDTAATSPDDIRPPPLPLSKSLVEPDLPSPVSFTRTDDGTTWEGSVKAQAVVTGIEERLVNGELPSIPLGFDEDPANWMYTHDYSLEDVAYNTEGHLVGATIEALVEKMTPHDAIVDPAFSSVFFMTFRLFTTPTELVDAIIARYNLVPPRSASMSIEELRLWQHKKGLPVRLRVANLIKAWVEMYWRGGIDDVIIAPLSAFTKDALGGFFPGPAQRISELLELRKQAAETGKGEQRLRDIPNPLVPSISGLTSEIPRPNMTKALLAALRKKDYQSISVTDFDTVELARQFTIMECTLYCAIQPEEILEAGQQDGAKARSNANVKAVTTLSTVITGWVAESILNEQDMKKRTVLIKYFIKVADRCTALYNYSTSRSILAALDSSTIARLHQTWNGVPQKSKVQLESLRKLADHGRNYHEYRSKLRNTTPPAVPFLGLYLTDVTFCREGNPSRRTSPLNSNKKLINFNKYHKLARIVQDMQRFQVSYNLKAIPEVQDYLNVAFENSKRSGDLQDLYRRSLLVEPRQPADTAPTSDMRQLFNWAMRSQPATTAS